MSPKARFVFLSVGAGILGYALLGLAAGFIIGAMGDPHPHGPGAIMVAIIGAIYLAPVGAIAALIVSLILTEGSWKKLSAILGIIFVLILAALYLYVRMNRGS